MSSGDATASVCPKGWKLPTSTELQSLYNAYGNAANFISATQGTYSGRYSLNQVWDGGNCGEWWSSTANSAAHAYELYFYSSSVTVGAYTKANGRAVRCVAR